MMMPAWNVDLCALRREHLMQEAARSEQRRAARKRRGFGEAVATTRGQCSTGDRHRVASVLDHVRRPGSALLGWHWLSRGVARERG